MAAVIPVLLQHQLDEALVTAVNQDNLNQATLLIAAGASPNYQNILQTAATTVVDLVQIAKLLIANGANVNYESSGWAAASYTLFFAVCVHRYELIPLLLISGANINLQNNAVDVKRNFPEFCTVQGISLTQYMYEALNTYEAVKNELNALRRGAGVLPLTFNDLTADQLELIQEADDLYNNGKSSYKFQQYQEAYRILGLAKNRYKQLKRDLPREFPHIDRKLQQIAHMRQNCLRPIE